MKKIFSLSTITLKFILLIVIGLWVSDIAKAQSVSNSAIKQVQVQIEADSSNLKINGTTNINTFTCVYKGELPQESFKINLVPSDTSNIVRGARLKLKVKAFDCGKTRMNNDFYELLKYKENPHIYLDVAEIWKNMEKGNTQNQHESDYHTRTIFTIAGNTEKYHVDVENNDSDNQPHTITAKGEQKLDITDFGLTPPKKFLGMIKVDKMVTVEFKMKMTVDFQPGS